MRVILPPFCQGGDDATVGDELEQGFVALFGGEAVLVFQDEFGEDSLQLLDGVSERRVRYLSRLRRQTYLTLYMQVPADSQYGH